MKIYLDKDFICHTEYADGLMEVETNAFDGKCQALIEGYRYVPVGETWIREDGAQFKGEMVTPITDYRILEIAQNESNKFHSEIFNLAKAGVEQIKHYCADTGKSPKAESGIFVKGVDPWESGRTYQINDLFSYDGKMGFVRQVHTAQEIWTPFSIGTESLYGARPAPDPTGVYPWVYNMAAVEGMRVKDPDDGVVYVCIQQIDNVLYKPHEIQAHFEKEVNSDG